MIFYNELEIGKDNNGIKERIRKIIETSFHFSFFLDSLVEFFELLFIGVLLEKFGEYCLFLGFEER